MSQSCTRRRRKYRVQALVLVVHLTLVTVNCFLSSKTTRGKSPLKKRKKGAEEQVRVWTQDKIGSTHQKTKEVKAMSIIPKKSASAPILILPFVSRKPTMSAVLTLHHCESSSKPQDGSAALLRSVHSKLAPKPNPPIPPQAVPKSPVSRFLSSEVQGL